MGWLEACRQTERDAPAKASGTIEYLQSVVDPLVRNEHLHTGCSAFHGRLDTNDGRGHAGGVQCDSGHLGVNARGVGLDDLHDDLPRRDKGDIDYARFADARTCSVRGLGLTDR
jgi:hypothetical protein